MNFTQDEKDLASIFAEQIIESNIDYNRIIQLLILEFDIQSDFLLTEEYIKGQCPDLFTAERLSQDLKAFGILAEPEDIKNFSFTERKQNKLIFSINIFLKDRQFYELKYWFSVKLQKAYCLCSLNHEVIRINLDSPVIFRKQ